MRSGLPQPVGRTAHGRRRSVTSLRTGVLALVAVLALLVPVTAARPAQAAAPAAPTDVQAVPNGNGVYVTFTAAEGASQYEIWRDGTPLGTTSSTQFDDDTTTRGQHYLYTVRAVSPRSSAFARAYLSQWTDDGSRTWLSTAAGPASCGRFGDGVDVRRVICTTRTATGWRIDRTTKNVSWGNPGNRAWFTVDGKPDYCDLVGKRPAAMRVSCVELGAKGWGAQSTSGVTDWGLGGNRTWLESGSGPALCARTETAAVHGLVCTVRTDDAWKTYRTEQPIDWGHAENRTWLAVNGTITYCATVGDAPDTRAACVALGQDGWEEQSVSPVTDWGLPAGRTWVVSAQGPALCGLTDVGESRRVVCITRTAEGWKTDTTPEVVDWGRVANRAFLSVNGRIDYCDLVGSDVKQVACLELGPSGWGPQTRSAVTEWGDPANRTWVVGREGPALCGRRGGSMHGAVVCTERTDQGWTSHRSPAVLDTGYDAERAWVSAAGQVSFCSVVGDWPGNMRVATTDLTTSGWGAQSISPRTDWGAVVNNE